jgi:hypothetical protein
MLIVSFGSRELLDHCRTLEATQQWLGPIDAEALVALLADAESMRNAAELMELHEGTAGNLRDSLSVAVGPHYRATFVAVGASIPRGPDGLPDWISVRRLMLVEVSHCK